jgi:hypothetical protein
MSSTNESNNLGVINKLVKPIVKKREVPVQKIFLATEEQKHGKSYKKAMIKFTKQLATINKPPPHCLLLQHHWLGKRYTPCQNKHPWPLEQP